MSNIPNFGKEAKLLLGNHKKVFELALLLERMWREGRQQGLDIACDRLVGIIQVQPSTCEDT